MYQNSFHCTSFQGFQPAAKLWCCSQAKCWLLSWLRPETTLCGRMGTAEITAHSMNSQPSASAPGWLHSQPPGLQRFGAKTEPQLSCLYYPTCYSCDKPQLEFLWHMWFLVWWYVTLAFYLLLILSRNASVQKCLFTFRDKNFRQYEANCWVNHIP